MTVRAKLNECGIFHAKSEEHRLAPVHACQRVPYLYLPANLTTKLDKPSARTLATLCTIRGHERLLSMGRGGLSDHHRSCTAELDFR